MKATKTLLKQANAITNKYNRWLLPNELQGMYSELNGIGISTDILTNRRDYNLSCDAYGYRAIADVFFDGELLDNTQFIYCVYTDLKHDERRNEYTIYFS